MKSRRISISRPREADKEGPGRVVISFSLLSTEVSVYQLKLHNSYYPLHGAIGTNLRDCKTTVKQVFASDNTDTTLPLFIKGWIL